MKINTITLEILRGGPPHNQLLSPLTDYLALCGDAGPHAVHMPFEHRDLMDRLSLLRYNLAAVGDQFTQPEELRRSEIKRLGRDIGGVLGIVPAFRSEVVVCDPCGDALVHIRLVLSGSELSLIPWEMAQVPAGLPGAGLPLLLQARTPTTLTREVRGAGRRCFEWDRKPRILFASGHEEQFPHGTVDAHYLALRYAVDSWMAADPMQPSREPKVPIVVIKSASVDAIRAACRDDDFTHVHILAHGAQVPGQDRQFGVLLHDSASPAQFDVVSGERLAQALLVDKPRGKRSDPLVVTLATCYSSTVETVLIPGGSVAHELHAHGLPWVIASQFPLTVDGSVILAGDFYESLLRGTDPRRVVADVRNHMAARFTDRHDWGSLVVFASLPPGFEEAVGRFRKSHVDATRNHAFSLLDLITAPMLKDGHSALDHLSGSDGSRRPADVGSETSASPSVATTTPPGTPATSVEAREAIQPPSKAVFDRVAAAMRKAREAREGAKELLPEGTDAGKRAVRASHWGNLGSLAKREAELHFLHRYLLEGKLEPDIDDEERRLLQLSRDDYLQGVREGAVADHWALGQVAVLNEILEIPIGDEEDDPLSQAKSAVSIARKSPEAKDAMFAYSTRAELILVELARQSRLKAPPNPDQEKGPTEYQEAMKQALEEHMRRARQTQERFAVWSTFRQFWRYRYWWRNKAWDTAVAEGYEMLRKDVFRR